MAVTKTDTTAIQEADRRTHLHPFTAAADHAEALPRVMVEGAGVHVRDDTGRKYLDGMAGLTTVSGQQKITGRLLRRVGR